MPKLKIAGTAIAVAIFSASLTLCPGQTGAPSQGQEPSNTFTEEVAARLLSQMAEGLQGHSQKKMLSAFDLARMDGGATFKEQITAFFNQYETIRVHFKLIEVKDDTAVVDAELDGTPHDAITPPEHKRMQLTFTAGKGADGWKFIDVQPRMFFT
ncbi:MAG TPA: hypothetical protein VI685_22000 [Candidatus Angelobacter sp.]